MIDTSVLLAGLVAEHEFHVPARPRVVSALSGRIPGIVVAEAWAALRRRPWSLSAGTVAALLGPWQDEARILATPPSAYAQALREGPGLHLGGNVHDYLIAVTCAQHSLTLATLDRRQADIARAIPGLAVDFLLE